MRPMHWLMKFWLVALFVATPVVLVWLSSATWVWVLLVLTTAATIGACVGLFGDRSV